MYGLQFLMNSKVSEKQACLTRASLNRQVHRTARKYWQKITLRRYESYVLVVVMLFFASRDQVCNFVSVFLCLNCKIVGATWKRVVDLLVRGRYRAKPYISTLSYLKYRKANGYLSRQIRIFMTCCVRVRTVYGIKCGSLCMGFYFKLHTWRVCDLCCVKICDQSHALKVTQFLLRGVASLVRAVP